MRVSTCGIAAKNLEEAITLSCKVTEVTHNNPEGIKGAEATAVCVFLARAGKNLLEIRDYVNRHYYPMDFTLDGIRENYRFNETCQDTVPQAIMAFLESSGFEDAIRNAISIGGDAYDNAMAESINALFKAEVIRLSGPWKGVEDVEFATLKWVDWYNHRRILEPIGYVSPAEFEMNYFKMAENQAA